MKIVPKPLRNQKGLSLLLILLVFIGVSMVAYGAVYLSVYLQKEGEGNITDERLDLIQLTMKDYYRGHQDLPAPTSVPVAALGLESKYKLDAWGHQFKYYYRPSISTDGYFGNADDRTIINNFTVDGTSVQAGVLLSGGPDGEITTATPAGCNETTGVCTAAATFTFDGDDILIPINLQEEAREIANETLRLLKKKVWTYKKCQGSLVPVGSTVRSDFGLSSQFHYDPWGNAYSQDPTGNFYSTGGGSSNITVSEDKSTCPDAATGNGGPGTPEGGTTEADSYFNFGTASPSGTTPSGDPASNDGALEFDGDDDLKIDNPSTFSFERTDSFTIALWIKTSTADTEMAIISKMQDNGDDDPGPGYEIKIGDDNKIHFIMIDDASPTANVIDIISTNTVTDGDCRHLVVTYNGSGKESGMKIYINGADDTDSDSVSGTPALTASIKNDKSFQISGREGQESDILLFTGIIDELAIYSSMILSTEIEALYDSQKTWSHCTITYDEFQVNTYYLRNQEYPSVAPLTNGGFVVTWESWLQDTSQEGIYGQMYNSNGSEDGDEFQVNTYYLRNQQDPSVTALTTGGFVVTWESEDQDTSGYGIYGQRFDSDGAKDGDEFQVNTYTTSYQRNPSVAALTSGTFVVTWESWQDGSGYGIYGQRHDSDGAKDGDEFQVNTYTADNQTDPSVATLNNGGFVVTWHSYDGQDGDRYGIYGQRYDSDGAQDGDEFQVNTYTTSIQSNPSVAALNNGGFVVTWQSFGQDRDQTGIYGQRYDSDGAKDGSEFKVNTYTASTQASPSVAAHNSGGFVVTWASYGQDSSDYGVYGQRYDSDGSPDCGEFQVNTYTDDDQRYPSGAALTDGGFVVTWQSNGQVADNSVYRDIFGQQYQSDCSSGEDDGPLDGPIDVLN